MPEYYEGEEAMQRFRKAMRLAVGPVGQAVARAVPYRPKEHESDLLPVHESDGDPPDEKGRA